MADEDPQAILDALDEARAAFDGRDGAPAYEVGLDPDDPETTQLRKACRLLDACRTLRANDGYHTSVVEMSFAALERSLEFYALSETRDTFRAFQTHEAAYDRAAELGVLSPTTADELYGLHRDHRSAAYYRDSVATERQAETVFRLAVAVHEHAADLARRSHECHCSD